MARDDAAHLRELYREVYEVVRRIPPGRVATYGEIAELAGRPGAARAVGAAMRASTPELGLPWHRVVGKRGAAQGRIAIHDPVGAAVQRQLLEAEGVVVSDSGGVALAACGWLWSGRR